MREDEPQRGQGHLRQEEEEEAEGVELEEAHVLPKGADAAREADLEGGIYKKKNKIWATVDSQHTWNENQIFPPPKKKIKLLSSFCRWRAKKVFETAFPQDTKKNFEKPK